MNANGALVILEALGEQPPYELVTDPGRRRSQALDWMTVYLVDAQGRVREVFPTRFGLAPPWDAVLRRIDQLQREAQSE